MTVSLIVSGKKTGLSVSDVVFGHPFNESLVHQVVVAQLACLRAGTKAQKTRSEVRGGGVKPWRQKGTGRARAGTIRSPLWRTGGVTFAAKPRDYSQKVNRKMYRTALRAILSELVRQERLVVIEGITITEPKTCELVKQLKKLEVSNALIVMDNVSQHVYLAARNLPNIKVCDVTSVDPMNLVLFDKVLFTAEAVKRIEERLR